MQVFAADARAVASAFVELYHGPRNLRERGSGVTCRLPDVCAVREQRDIAAAPTRRAHSRRSIGCGRSRRRSGDIGRVPAADAPVASDGGRRLRPLVAPMYSVKERFAMM